jgi:hypothetical protein
MWLRAFGAYLATVRRFVDTHLRRYDVVLENGWLLSAYLAAQCSRRGVPAIVVENSVRVWNEPLREARDVARVLRFRLAQALVGRYLPRSPLIIAETDELPDRRTPHRGLAARSDHARRRRCALASHREPRSRAPVHVDPR